MNYIKIICRHDFFKELNFVKILLYKKGLLLFLLCLKSNRKCRASISKKETKHSIATKNSYLIPISLKHGGVSLLYFKPRLFDLTEFLV